MRSSVGTDACESIGLTVVHFIIGPIQVIVASNTGIFIPASHSAPLFPVGTIAHPDVKFPGKLIIIHIGYCSIEMSGTIGKLVETTLLYVEEETGSSRHILEPANSGITFIGPVHIDYITVTALIYSAIFINNGHIPVTVVHSG